MNSDPAINPNQPHTFDARPTTSTGSAVPFILCGIVLIGALYVRPPRL